MSACVQREEGGQCASSDTDILEIADKANAGHTPPTHSPVIRPVFSCAYTVLCLVQTLLGVCQSQVCG